MSDSVEIDCEIFASTEKAIMIENLKGEDVWLPLSQIEVLKEDCRQNAVIEVPEWLAIDKELV